MMMIIGMMITVVNMVFSNGIQRVKN